MGGGTPAANRFRQLARCRMRTISQITKANSPPGMVTSINQPSTPSVYKSWPSSFPLMMQGCTDPSSTLQPWELAIQAHVITDPTGANAKRTMKTSTIQYKIHGKRFRIGKGGGFIAGDAFS